MKEFQTFFQQTRERFFNFLLRLTGNADRAADIFQESYTRYWERYGDRDPNAGLLFTIGRNAAIDGHRRRSRQQPFDDNCMDERPSQETALVVKESYRQVLAAMALLDPLERQVLSLAIDGGFRYEEIARITGISTTNVKVKIHRARRKLRRHIEEN